MQLDSPGLTVVGLGPGGWSRLTLEAVQILEAASHVYVRTARHPTVTAMRERLPGVTIHSFDSLYETLSSPEEVQERVAQELCELAGAACVVFAVPGSAAMGDAGVRLLLQRLQTAGVPFRVVPGLSAAEPALGAAGAAGAPWVEVLHAAEVALMGSENAVGEVPGMERRLPFRAPVPTAPLVVSHLGDRETADGVQRWLHRFYPAQHAVLIVPPGGPPRELPLSELEGAPEIGGETAVYVPPLAETDNVRTFPGLMQLTRTLRAPGGCPWDREQTHDSLKPHLLEEAYEVLDALDSGEPETICEELGDLLFQVTIHSQVAAEAGTFTVEDVIEGVMTKLIGRHPHVFGELELESAQDVRHAWESFKQREKPKRTSVLEEIPRGMPALPQSNLMQKRAASVGFEWPGVSEVIAKVEEELDELRAEIEAGTSKEQQREEYGDILFALVSVARHLRIDPEEALRLANRKFASRFRHVEARVAAQGRSLRDLSPDQLDAYWNEAKAEGAAT